MTVENSAVLVTGGASGLGAATVEHFVALGHPVVVLDRDPAACAALAGRLGDRGVVVTGSVLDDDDVRSAIDAADRLGGLRWVVACAGGGEAGGRVVGRDGTPHDREVFERTMSLNVTGSFNTVRLCASAMAGNAPDAGAERGAIVLVSSAAGYEGQIGQIAYGSAKAALIGMTLIAARDLSSIGVRVNAIAPGVMDTAAWSQAPPDLKAALEATVPFPRRLGAPDEFARLAEHLLTNRYMNGHVARLDGALRFAPK
jgi:NAD(P)-dependent dehydrogenase (short-subunit alcohol dehydrogenase family)